MGEFLSTPNKEKESDSNENSFVSKHKIINIISFSIAPLWFLWNAGMA